MKNNYLTARTCYECESFNNIFNKNQKTICFGTCSRLSDCAGESYLVKKENKKCLFANPDKKLSLEEIETRDEKDMKKYESFNEGLRRAKEIVNSWPEWKRNILI